MRPAWARGCSRATRKGKAGFIGPLAQCANVKLAKLGYTYTWPREKLDFVEEGKGQVAESP